MCPHPRSDTFRSAAPSRAHRDPVKLRDVARSAARHLFWRFGHYHRDAGLPPILLLTSRRSGGTWLLESLGAAPGLATINQPLSIAIGDPLLRLTGTFPAQLLAHHGVPTRPADEVWMTRFFDRLFRGALPVELATSPRDPRHHLLTRRVLVKEHNVKAWVSWFEETFPGLQIMFHVRHPIPQALSMARRGWPDRLDDYLRDPWFTGQVLGDLLGPVRRFEARARPLGRGVLHWGIENLVPLRLHAARPRWLVTTYEELLVSPHVFERAVERLGLVATPAVRGQLERPSHTSDREVRGAIRGQRRGELLQRWWSEVDAEDRRHAQDALDLLGLGAYNTRELCPAASLLHDPTSLERIRALES